MARHKRRGREREANLNQQQAALAQGQANSNAYQVAHPRPPAPGAPGTPANQPAPFEPRPPDWQEQMAMASANRNVGLADSQAAYDSGRIGRDFGYLPNGQINPNDPYGAANLLEQNYKNSVRGTTNSMAAQGQLYAGATQNAQNENARQHSMGVNQLQNQYQDALHGVAQNQLGAYANAGSSVSDASFQALLKKLNGG